MTEQALTPVLLSTIQFDHHPSPFLGIANGINARDRGDDDDVAAREEGRRRGQAQATDFLIDVGVFLDVEIVLGDVGFRLIIVVVGDKILDGVAGEELAKLGI